MAFDIEKKSCFCPLIGEDFLIHIIVQSPQTQSKKKKKDGKCERFKF